MSVSDGLGGDVKLPFPAESNTATLADAVAKLLVEHSSNSESPVKGHCRGFGLETSGNRANFWAQLEGFRKNNTACERFHDILVEPSKDMRTPEQIEGVLSWARERIAMYPYIPDPDMTFEDKETKIGSPTSSQHVSQERP
jgi:hypothetical protein